MDSDLSALTQTLDRVANYTVEMSVEGLDWQKGVGIEGLLAAGRHETIARGWMERAIATQTSAGQYDYGFGDYPGDRDDRTTYDLRTYKPTINPAMLARSALTFYERTGEAHFLDSIAHQYQFFEQVDRTRDGGLSRRTDRIEIYSETLYFLCPFFIRYGRLIESESPIEDGILQTRVHLDRLFDDEIHLFRHLWVETPNSYPDGGIFWSRANGWALAGLIESYIALPSNHPLRPKLSETIADMATRLRHLQDRSGFWHLKLDDCQSPLETSGTAIFAYSFNLGIEHGLLDRDTYLEPARHAMAACLGVVDDVGAVTRVSVPPASSESAMGTTPYGQGWVLLAGQAFERGT